MFTLFQLSQEAEAAKEDAEQRFWLPLERSKGRQMGELCVSLLFTKVSCLVVTCSDQQVTQRLHCLPKIATL